MEAIVIYDDDCGFCRWSLALLLCLDRGALRPLPLGTPEADYLLHDLTAEERDASWHLVIDPPAAAEFEQLSLDLAGPAPPAGPAGGDGAISAPVRFRAAASVTSVPVRFSAGAAFAPALRALPRGRRAAWLVARMPGRTERGYRWVAEHRGPLGRFVPGRARRWADSVIAAHGGPRR